MGMQLCVRSDVNVKVNVEEKKKVAWLFKGPLGATTQHPFVAPIQHCEVHAALKRRAFLCVVLLCFLTFFLHAGECHDAHAPGCAPGLEVLPGPSVAPPILTPTTATTIMIATLFSTSTLK